MRPRLSYANVMATIAVFIALGGVSYAVTQLPKNSVGSKQLKKNAVTTAKIKKQAVTAAKIKDGTLTGKQIDVATLGTVPSAQSAQTANALAPHEPWHEVGTPSGPSFLNGWHNEAQAKAPGPTVAFFKDHDGVVHFRGVAAGGESNEPIFELPPGYRPLPEKFLVLAVTCGGGPTCEYGVAQGFAYGAGFGALSNSLVGPPAAEGISFDGLTFVPEA